MDWTEFGSINKCMIILKSLQIQLGSQIERVLSCSANGLVEAQIAGLVGMELSPNIISTLLEMESGNNGPIK